MGKINIANLPSKSAYTDGILEKNLELIIGEHNMTKPGTTKVAFTKWCPAENGIKTFENAEAAVDLALRRMKQDKIALLQCA